MSALSARLRAVRVAIAAGGIAVFGSRLNAGETTRQDDLSVLLGMAKHAQESCEAKGFPTTVTIVGLDGQTIVVLRSDNAPIHTIQNSFNKAYTIMSLGPLAHVDKTSDLGQLYKDQPSVSYALPMDPLPHISFSSGAVLVRLNGRLIGGLGVSGSKTGAIDEACAAEGVDFAR